MTKTERTNALIRLYNATLAHVNAPAESTYTTVESLIAAACAAHDVDASTVPTWAYLAAAATYRPTKDGWTVKVYQTSRLKKILLENVTVATCSQAAMLEKEEPEKKPREKKAPLSAREKALAEMYRAEKKYAIATAPVGQVVEFPAFPEWLEKKGLSLTA